MLTQLTTQDAIYLYMETPETPTHVGGVSLVDVPEGHRGAFFAEIGRASCRERVYGLV